TPLETGVGAGLRRHDGICGRRVIHPTTVIPTKVGTHASFDALSTHYHEDAVQQRRSSTFRKLANGHSGCAVAQVRLMWRGTSTLQFGPPLSCVLDSRLRGNDGLGA